MDIVYIKQLVAYTCIGIHAWERKIRQKIILDLDMSVDVAACAQHDDLQKTLDYDHIARSLVNSIERSEVKLIETLAEKLAQQLINEFGVKWLRLKLNKPGAVDKAKEVGVIIERAKAS